MPTPVLTLPADAPLPEGAVRADDATEDAVLRAFAHGARQVVVDRETPGVRRAALLADTLAEVLATGAFHDDLRATGGLRASEWRTRQRGAALFVENPGDTPAVGSVFPALPDLSLTPGEVFVWVHDLPIGASATYLAAYAGLVKSDARLLDARLRPDPHEGARVIVHGAPGDTREVVLFFSGRGEPVSVRFDERPAVHTVASCLVIAVPTELAGDARLTDDTCRFGPWQIDADGALSFWTEHDIRLPAETSARLDPTPLEARLDDAPSDPADLTLPAGPSRLALRWPDGPPDAPLLLPDGACYVVALD